MDEAVLSSNGYMWTNLEDSKIGPAKEPPRRSQRVEQMRNRILDCFTILQIQPTDEVKQLTKAYRRLALIHQYERDERERERDVFFLFI